MCGEIRLLFSSTSVNNVSSHCKCGLTWQYLSARPCEIASHPLPIPGFQILISTKICRSNYLEYGRIILRCNLNLNGLLKHCYLVNVYLWRRTSRFFSLQIQVRLKKKKLIPIVYCQKIISHLLKKLMHENDVCSTQMSTNGSKVHYLTPGCPVI